MPRLLVRLVTEYPADMAYRRSLGQPPAERAEQEFCALALVGSATGVVWVCRGPLYAAARSGGQAGRF
jgi:hypothetical protein